MTFLLIIQKLLKSCKSCHKFDTRCPKILLSTLLISAENLFPSLWYIRSYNKHFLTSFFLSKKWFVNVYASGPRISTVTDVGPTGAVGDLNIADLRDVAEWPLLALEPLRDPGMGECALRSCWLACRDGGRMLTREPRRSWECNSLESLNKDTFIRRGFGVLKIVRFSLHLALLNSLRTTQIMTNIRAMPTRTPIIAGSKVLIGSSSSLCDAQMMAPSMVTSGTISNLHAHRSFLHSDLNSISSHCSLNMQVSLIDAGLPHLSTWLVIGVFGLHWHILCTSSQTESSNLQSVATEQKSPYRPRLSASWMASWPLSSAGQRGGQMTRRAARAASEAAARV